MSNKRIEYMPIYNEPKVIDIGIYEKEKKVVRERKPSNNSSSLDIFDYIKAAIIIIGAFLIWGFVGTSEIEPAYPEYLLIRYSIITFVIMVGLIIFTNLLRKVVKKDA